MSSTSAAPAPTLRRAGRMGGQAVTRTGSRAAQRVLRQGGALLARLNRFPNAHAALLLSIYNLIPQLFDPSRAGDLEASFELRIRDPAGGGDDVSSVIVSGGTCRIVPRRNGPARREPPPRVVVTAGADDLVRMASGDIGWPQLVSAGRMVLWGDPYLALRFPLLFGMPAGPGRPAFLNLLPTRRRSPPVAARTPKLSRWARALSPAIASPAGSWFYLNVAPRIDRRLLPATNGRLSISIGQPVLCLEVRGAKSGEIRRTPLLFSEVDGELVIVASAAGRPRHPAWYHNLRKHPRVKVYAPRGRTGDYIARTVEGAERERMWEAARALYSGFDVYADRAAGAREIPVVALRRA